MRANAVTVPPSPVSTASVGRRGQPSLDRPQVEGVELPLDLDGIGLLARSFSLESDIALRLQRDSAERRARGPHDCRQLAR